MRTVHTIRVSASSAECVELEAFGLDKKVVRFPGGNRSDHHFLVGEDDPTWKQVEAWLSGRKGVRHYIHTEFSQADEETASWLQMYAWEHGYPQPEKRWGFREVTYALTEWCDTCWVGKRQKAPFRMEGEPPWDRHELMTLNWVSEEVFVTPDLWRSVFESRGVRCGPVLNKNGDDQLKTVVQLLVEEEVDIVTDGLAYTQCPTCSRKKYAPIRHGAFPSFAAEPRQSLVRTRQSFGQGHAADKAVIVSQALRQALAKENVRGLRLTPMGPIAFP